MSDWIAIVISLGAFLCSLYIVKSTNKNDNRVDTNKEIRIAESFKELNVKLDYQGKQLDEMNLNFRTQAKENQELHDKILALEAKLEKAFSLIDTLKKEKE